ncbi:MAG: bifunctional DNA-formamidopyrimidine glycosylase/DNA-(apurinic or apyrimidinic site) lyase [Burkholderiales bacterium]
MPELPEVEITLRGIAPHITGRRIRQLRVRNAALRWPVPKDLPQRLKNQRIAHLSRRGKYILVRCDSGSLILHLGMSGSLRVLTHSEAPHKHDHFDLLLENATLLRFRDPRRFGALLWTADDVMRHPLLAELGVEPLGREFNAEYLYTAAHVRTLCIKNMLMDAHVVVGIGNIYANEALFLAGINPRTQAKRISLQRYALLVDAIRQTLHNAIEAGGSTLRDFVNSAGEPGYFQQYYKVYGRAGLPCARCNAALHTIRQGQRSTFYCPRCQR